MDQFIIIGGWPLPEPPFDQYSCWEDMLSVQVDMISGRRVVEQRGKVWRVSVSYDYLTEAEEKPVMAALRTAGPLIATVLPDNGEGRITSSFLVESITQPTLLAFDGDQPLWHGLGFTLREERPHD